MTKDQIFVGAIGKCKGVINLKYISLIVTEDKTNTIKKYLNDFGHRQLAYYLSGLASSLYPSKSLSIDLKIKKKHSIDVSHYIYKPYSNIIADIPTLNTQSFWTETSTTGPVTGINKLTSPIYLSEPFMENLDEN